MPLKPKKIKKTATKKSSTRRAFEQVRDAVRVSRNKHMEPPPSDTGDIEAMNSHLDTVMDQEIIRGVTRRDLLELAEEVAHSKPTPLLPDQVIDEEQYSLTGNLDALHEITAEMEWDNSQANRAEALWADKRFSRLNVDEYDVPIPNERPVMNQFSVELMTAFYAAINREIKDGASSDAAIKMVWADLITNALNIRAGYLHR